MLDRVDTPPDLAAAMVAAATIAEPPRVADFAAGGGALLHAARRRWPAAEILATDIDPRAVAALGSANPGWRVGRLDFGSAAARGLDPLVRMLSAEPGLILLNPPFSERGAAARWTVRVAGETLRCGRALAFACWAAELLPPGGELVSLLPAGVIYSERDAAALAALGHLGEVEIVPSEEESLFSGYRLRTVTLRLHRRPLEDLAPSSVAVSRALPAEPIAWLSRGKLKACAEAGRRFRGPAFIHTTDLRDPLLRGARRLPAGHPHAGRAFSGPTVLVPRVGRPDHRKVCVWHAEDGPVVLSDCVIAVHASSVAVAEQIAAALLGGWSMIEACYGGTCAPYITLRRLAAVLAGFGLPVGLAGGGVQVASGSGAPPSGPRAGGDDPAARLDLAL